MSLKAKFEAIIYAADEPVTLAQLVTLFASELTPAPVQPANFQDASEETALESPDASEPGAPDIPAPRPDLSLFAEAARTSAAAARVAQRVLRDAAEAIVSELIADYATGGDAGRGMEIREVAGGYRMATKPEYHDAVRGFIKSLKPPLKLSLPALETLAVIAYKQPVTAPEIGEIRGVDSGGVLGGLLARKLITTAGRKQVLGRPILYKTTQEFLLRFGLKDVNELPSLEEFEKMAAEITEFDDGLASPQQVADEEAALTDAEDAEPAETGEGSLAQPPAAAESDSFAVAVEEEQVQP